MSSIRLATLTGLFALAPIAVTAAPTAATFASVDEGQADVQGQASAADNEAEANKEQGNSGKKRKGKRKDDDRPQDTGPLLARANELRSQMMEHLGELKALEEQAKKDGDMARVGCVRDKQELAEKLMEDVVAPDGLVVLDTTAGAKERQFAVNKLDEASVKLGRIVDQARACAGEKGPEEEDGKTRNAVDLDRFIPFLDPTLTPVQPTVPPAVDPTRPPVVQSPVM